MSGMPNKERPEKKTWAFAAFSLPTTPFHVFSGTPVFLSRQKAVTGLPPYHRWPFNTSVATTNEPGVAAAWLDLGVFAQTFMSLAPVLLGWEMHVWYIYACLSQLLVSSERSRRSYSYTPMLVLGYIAEQKVPESLSVFSVCFIKEEGKSCCKTSLFSSSPSHWNLK